MQMRLARNLGAIQNKRPDIYKKLIETGPQTQCQITRLGDGDLSIVQALPGGKPVALKRQRQSAVRSREAFGVDAASHPSQRNIDARWCGRWVLAGKPVWSDHQ